MRLDLTRPISALRQLRYSFRHVVVLVSAVLALLILYVVVGSRGGHHDQLGLGMPDSDREVVIPYGHEYGFKPKTPVRKIVSCPTHGLIFIQFQGMPSGKWAERAEKVKEAFVFAYSNYERYAFPRDELYPISRTPRDK